ncbi:twin-arginine translocase TatA/TatE family subunit [Actinomyces ruminicola]|uniref:Sec-independent protein translocase protein TatA n=1 Tax=Actinomyces ruminicola TaxID=332524 RepID=A0A1G9YUM6_9ACTO|nr:twin-arginine translocase TatA/TatE family subunit [Actinomyces ruminicola]SDN12385.1 Sec-independent protein translocase protein TatA [Actinomyces ruminicola]
MIGISGPEFFVLLLVVVIVVGPQRLPEYTRKLTQGVRRLRLFLDDAKTQIAEEVGPELGDLDLSDLDPRNYDPRKIVRDALGEDLDAIRRDLTNPFQSVVDTAKEASNEAAAAVSGKKKSRPLSKMIEDKAEETRTARAASATAATAAASGPQAPDADDKDPQRAVAEAAAVTAELPQVDPTAGSTPERSAEEPGAVVTAAEADEAAPADSARLALEAGETVTAEIPEVKPLAAGAEEPAKADAGGAESTLASAPTGTVTAADAPAIEDRAAAARAAADIPSSLEPGGGEDDEPVQRKRPVSPRDIVRAANEAARTRAEAAAAVA